MFRHLIKREHQNEEKFEQFDQKLKFSTIWGTTWRTGCGILAVELVWVKVSFDECYSTDEMKMIVTPELIYRQDEVPQKKDVWNLYANLKLFGLVEL